MSPSAHIYTEGGFGLALLDYGSVRQGAGDDAAMVSC